MPDALLLDGTAVLSPKFQVRFKEMGDLIKDLCTNAHHLTQTQIAGRLREDRYRAAERAFLTRTVRAFLNDG